jgi:hypothetical protein
MEMNDKTILRIKVPAHLYESVKAQLTLNEAKGKQNLGAGMEVVKEKKNSGGDKPKKTSAPKKANAPVRADGDHAPKADKDIKGAGMTEKKLPKDGHKKMGLDELKALAEMLKGQIAEMEKHEEGKVEEYHEPENVYDDEIEDDSKKKVKEARDFSGYLTGKETGDATAAIEIIDAAIKDGKEVKIHGDAITDIAAPFFTVITGVGDSVKGYKLIKPENIQAVTIDGKTIEDQIKDVRAKMPKITAADYVTPKEIPLSSRFD